MALQTRAAILYDVREDAQDILTDRQPPHPRGNVTSAALRKNLRQVITQDFNYAFSQYSVYSKEGLTLEQCVAEARAISRMGPPTFPATSRRNLSWLRLPERPASLASGEIVVLDLENNEE